MIPSRSVSQANNGNMSNGNGGSVRDIIMYLNSDAIPAQSLNLQEDETTSSSAFAAKFQVWLEQLSWMLLLPSHRRVPDFDTGSNHNGPLVQFSVVCSPDAKAVAVSRFVHSQITSFFAHDDSTKQLVQITKNIACHRSLMSAAQKSTTTCSLQEMAAAAASTTSSSQQRPARRISLADIVSSSGSNNSAAAPLCSSANNSCERARSVESTYSVDSSVAAAATGEVGQHRLARVATCGPPRPPRNETRADASERIVNFCYMLEACMDATKITSGAPGSAAGSSSDSDDDERYNNNNNNNNHNHSCGGAAVVEEEGVSSRLPQLGLSLRQVVIVVCNEFAYSVAANKCVPLMEGAEPCFLWVRNSNQHRWQSPALWKDSSVPPRSAAASLTPPPRSNNDVAVASKAIQQQQQQVQQQPQSDVEMSMQYVEEGSARKLAANNTATTSALQDDQLEVEFSLNSGASPSPAVKRPVVAAFEKKKVDEAEQEKEQPQQQQQADADATTASRSASLRAALAFFTKQEAKVEAELKQIEEEEQRHKSRSCPRDTDAQEEDAVVDAVAQEADNKNSNEHQQQNEAVATEVPAKAHNALCREVPRVEQQQQEQPQEHPVIPRYAAPLARQQQQQQQPRPGSRTPPVTSRSSSGTNGRMALGQRTVNQQQQQTTTARRTSSSNSDAKNSTSKNNNNSNNALCPVDMGPRRTSEAACLQLYQFAKCTARSRSQAEKLEEQRRREKEEEELRALHKPHPTLTLRNVGAEAEKKLLPKIVRALRADPFSEEGMKLVPNFPDRIPEDRVRMMLRRLAPPPAANKAKTTNNSEQGSRTASSNASVSSRTASNSRNNNLPSSRGSTPPAWRHGGVAMTPTSAAAAAAAAVRSNGNTPRAGSASSNKLSTNTNPRNFNGTRVRSESPITDRLYRDRNMTREAHEAQQKRHDEREINAIIAQRKIDNPTWAKTVRKDPQMEENYRKRLLKARVEERKMQESLQHKMARSDPRFADSVASAVA